jgi:hypothetical protein
MIIIIEIINNITSNIFLALGWVPIQPNSILGIIRKTIQDIKFNEHFIMIENVKIYIIMPNKSQTSRPTSTFSVSIHNEVILKVAKTQLTSNVRIRIF